MPGELLVLIHTQSVSYIKNKKGRKKPNQEVMCPNLFFSFRQKSTEHTLWLKSDISYSFALTTKYSGDFGLENQKFYYFLLDQHLVPQGLPCPSFPALFLTSKNYFKFREAEMDQSLKLNANFCLTKWF